MNQALGHGSPPADVLITLNPDTVPPARSLTELVGRLDADPTLGMVVPMLTNEDGSPQHSVYRFPSPLITAIICLVPPAPPTRGSGPQVVAGGPRLPQ